VFTAEEAWVSRFGGESSVHLQELPVIPESWHDPDLAERWRLIREQRRLITTELEAGRKAGWLKSSLQGAVTLDQPSLDLLDPESWAELCIVSQAVPGAAIAAGPAPGVKCERCWRVLPEVGSVAAHPGLCLRCVGVVA
jgi:isoleucyl-tRNA synthetase